MSIFGILLGICLIIFREKISKFITNVYEKFPKYENGVKDLNLKFELRPIYIAFLGICVCIVSILSSL